MSEGTVNGALALPCICGDPASEHVWWAAEPSISMVGPCWHQDRLPPQADDPKVRHKRCPCRRYLSDRDLLRKLAPR